MRHKQRQMQMPGLDLAAPQAPITQPLRGLLPLNLSECSQDRKAAAGQRGLFNALLLQHHYLSHSSTVGENLQYLVSDLQGRPLACVLFGAAAWQCADRDRFIGWQRPVRAQKPSFPGQQHPFPSPSLGKSAAVGQPRLGRIARRLSAHCSPSHGHPFICWKPSSNGIASRRLLSSRQLFQWAKPRDTPDRTLRRASTSRLPSKTSTFIPCIRALPSACGEQTHSPQQTPMTVPETPPSTRRPHVKLRKARKTRQEQVQRLTDQILQGGSDLAAAAAAALSVTQAQLSDAELQAWRRDLNERLATVQQHPEQNLGFIEEHLARGSRELLRLQAQKAAQLKANTTPSVCSNCKSELVSVRYISRQIDSRFGQLIIFRAYGQCPDCGEWHFPADYALGLGKKAAASPYVQEVSALLVSKMPPEQAVLVAQRLGLDLSRCTLHREAHRQGLKAQSARADCLAQLDSWEEIKELAQSAAEGPPTQPFTLVIEIDAWNIRERDQWGQTEEALAKDKSFSRWHWVYVGTVFRLDHRSQSAGNRALISQRRYAATRQGIEALTRQLHREAIDCGLGQTQDVLVIGDGAVWIWNIAKDRFPDARQRLDLFHADEHLWSVANHLYGKGTPEAAQWVKPLLQQVRNDQTVATIQTLQELQGPLSQGLQEKVQTQINYFKSHSNRMSYKEIIEARKAVKSGEATAQQKLKANEPLGSGAIESTCRQYQCRFKRTGQFWSLAGDFALGRGAGVPSGVGCGVHGVAAGAAGGADPFRGAAPAVALRGRVRRIFRTHVAPGPTDLLRPRTAFRKTSRGQCWLLARWNDAVQPGVHNQLPVGILRVRHQKVQDPLVCSPWDP